MVYRTRDADAKIIGLLMQNADLTYKEMASRLKLNESTVRKRVLALQKSGIIKKYLVEVDTEKLGFKTNVMLGLDVDPSKMMEIGKKLTAIPETRMVYNTSGGNDFIVVIWTKDREGLAKVVDHISSFEGVNKVTPSFLVERLK